MESHTYPALEGGWGWFVVLSGFCLHVLTRGCLFSTGVLFSEWTTYFGKSKSETAWIGSIATGSALMLGPLASKLVERWGYRKTAIAGGIISFVGLFLSSWANSVYILYITYGVAAGTGMGFSYLCGVVAVGEYFDKRRSIAFGLAASGSGFGAAVMAILQEVLLNEYGWRGTMIILAGLSGLNQIVFGALLRPLSSSLNWRSRKRRTKLMDHMSPYQVNIGRINQLNGDAETPEIKVDSSSVVSSTDRLNMTKQDRGSACKLPVSPLITTSSMSPSLLLRRKQAIALQEKILSSNVRDLDPEVRSQFSFYGDDENFTCSLKAVNLSDGNISNGILAVSDQLKITSSDAVYLSNLSIASSRKAAKQISYSRANEKSQRFVSVSNMESTISVCETSKERLNKSGPTIADINNNTQPKVLRNPLFLIIVINQFFTGLGIMIPFVHLSQKAILMGFTARQAAYLISFIGIGNIVGKVVLGILCDMKCSSTYVVFVTTQFGLALSVMVYPLASEYYILVIASVLFGFFYGNYCAIPSLVTQYVGLNNLAEAIGYINFLEGAAGIVGPPLAGAIFDSSQSYNIAFAVSAIFLFVSVAVLGLQPFLYKRFHPSFPAFTIHSPDDLTAELRSENDLELKSEAALREVSEVSTDEGIA